MTYLFVHVSRESFFLHDHIIYVAFIRRKMSISGIEEYMTLSIHSCPQIKLDRFFFNWTYFKVFIIVANQELDEKCMSEGEMRIQFIAD